MKLFWLTLTSAIIYTTGHRNGQHDSHRNSFRRGVFSRELNLNTIKQFDEDLLNNKLSAYAYSVTNTNANSKAEAQTSITFHEHGLRNIQNAIPLQGFTFLQRNGFKPTEVEFTSNANYENRFNFGNHIRGAVVTIDADEYRQSAAVYPNNPKYPNINRSGKLDGSGIYGIFTSSQSVKSDISGQPRIFQQASTTINNNGKFNTYTVHNR